VYIAGTVQWYSEGTLIICMAHSVHIAGVRVATVVTLLAKLTAAFDVRDLIVTHVQHAYWFILGLQILTINLTINRKKILTIKMFDND